MLLSATVGCAAGLTSIAFYSLGLLIAPLDTEFGWGRASIASALLYMTATLALFSPMLGWLVDRFGPRRLALFSIPLLALTLVSLSQFNGPPVRFFAFYALLAIAGAGTTPITYTKAVNAVFDQKRGLALGIAIGGIGITAIGLPPLLQSVISLYGWRGAYIVLAVISIVPWPFVAFGMRQETLAPQRRKARQAFPLWVIKSRTFWTMQLCFAGVGTAVSAFTVHSVPMLLDSGASPTQAAGIASLTGIGVLVGRLAVGFTIDHLFAPFVAVAVFVGSAIGIVLLQIWGIPLAPVAALLIGLSLGAEIDLISYMTARYFGAESYGSVYSLIYVTFALGAAAGPAMAGALYDASGNYDITAYGSCALLVLGAVLAFSLPRFPSTEHQGPMQPQ